MATDDGAWFPQGPNDPDELKELLRRMLEGDGDVDPSELARAAGLPTDPAALSQLMQRLQRAMDASGDGIDWETAVQQAKSVARPGEREVRASERADYEQALQVADLWLSGSTEVGELGTTPRLMTRTEWIGATMPVWSELSEPVALSIANALTDVLTQQAPEELNGILANAGAIMRNLGGGLFAIQLGQIVGQLSSEVVSGGDVGIPLIETGQAALLPQNVDEFGKGLDVGPDQVRIYLAVRELAHARLFRHAKWLRLGLLSTITEFAQGIRIDTGRLEELAARFDPTDPQELRDALSSGQLIPPKSEQQLAALSRIETMLALIEGWVTVVTQQATSLLPSAAALAETVVRRRAAGGPAESAFATLIGLELRPRRLREAAAMWQQVTDAVGVGRRDALWSHPDLLPTDADIDDPGGLITRLTGPKPEPDDIDRELRDMLGDDASGSDPGGSDPGGSDAG